MGWGGVSHGGNSDKWTSWKTQGGRWTWADSGTKADQFRNQTWVGVGHSGTTGGSMGNHAHKRLQSGWCCGGNDGCGTTNFSDRTVCAKCNLSWDFGKRGKQRIQGTTPAASGKNLGGGKGKGIGGAWEYPKNPAKGWWSEKASWPKIQGESSGGGKSAGAKYFTIVHSDDSDEDMDALSEAEPDLGEKIGEAKKLKTNLQWMLGQAKKCGAGDGTLEAPTKQNQALGEEVKQLQKQRREDEPPSEQAKKKRIFLEQTRNKLQKAKDKKVELEEALEEAKQKVKDIDEQVEHLAERAREVEGEIDEVDQQILDDKEAIRVSRQDGGQSGGAWQDQAQPQPQQEDMETQQQLGYWIEKLKAQNTVETNAIVGQLDAWWIQQIQGDGGPKKQEPNTKESAGSSGGDGKTAENKNNKSQGRVEEPEGASGNPDKTKIEAAALVQGGKAKQVGGKAAATKPY